MSFTESFTIDDYKNANNILAGIISDYRIRIECKSMSIVTAIRDNEKLQKEYRIVKEQNQQYILKITELEDLIDRMSHSKGMPI